MEMSIVQTDQRAEAPSKAEPASSKRVWAGRIVGGLAAAFLLLDAVMKLILPEPVRKGFAETGYPESTARPIGALLLACVTLYVVPRTRVLGAVLLTGYLGGAVATHVRMGNPLFSHTLFPIYFGVMLWGSLLLRDDGLRAFFPLRK